MPPKFATLVMGTMIGVKKNYSLALQCPAQAFPVPIFRYLLFSAILNFIFLYIEPLGKVSPKFPNLDKGRLVDYEKSSSVTLLCPAQAFPIPLYR